jgi:hypothetical protein
MPEKLGAAVKRKRQRTCSVAAFFASIRASGAARVPERSAAGSDQLEAAPPPPQPLATSAAARAAALSAVAAARVR